MPKKTKDTNLKLVEKSEKDEMIYMLRQLSPEGLQKVGREFSSVIVNTMAKNMSAAELIAWRDKRSAERIPSPFPSLDKDLEDKYARAIVEKRRSEFKGIKGGAEVNHDN